MFSFFSRQTKAPERVPGDTVVPVGFFDDTIIFRTFVLYSLFVFDDVLDVERLRTSLESVVSRPGWKKLGGRLRRNDAGELEHHIPASFSRKDRPAIGFTHVDYTSQNIEAHPAASHIPRPPRDGRPTIVGDPDDLSEFTYAPGVPKTLDDYLYTDQPELGLHIVSFKNSTILMLHWMHLSFDAFAKRALLDAWTLTLEGREDEILEPLAPETYPLEHVGKQADKIESHVLAEQHISKPGLVWWALQNAYNLMFRTKEHRMLCVPASFLTKLRTQAMSELDGDFVSEGDVLVAYVTRLAVANLENDPDRPVAIQQAYQWRPSLRDLVPANKPFLGNCVGFLITLIPAKDLLQKPLSYVASLIRRSIKEQGTRAQIEAYAALIRLDTSNKAPPFFGDPSMQLVMFSNWRKANMYGTDLSAAAVKPRSTPLTPSYVQSVQGPYNFNDGFIIVGQDAEGNYWLSAYRGKGLWGMMEKIMAKEEAAN